MEKYAEGTIDNYWLLTMGQGLPSVSCLRVPFGDYKKLGKCLLQK